MFGHACTFIQIWQTTVQTVSLLNIFKSKKACSKAIQQMRGMCTHSSQTHLNLSEGMHDKYSKWVEWCVSLVSLLWHTIKSTLITFFCEQLYPTFQSHCRQLVFYAQMPCFHDAEQWSGSCGGDSAIMHPFDFLSFRLPCALCCRWISSGSGKRY